MGKALAESLSMRQNGLSLPKSLCLRWQYMQDFGSIFVKYSQYNSIQSFYKSTLGSIFSDMCVRPREQRFSLLENYNPVNTMNPIWILWNIETLSPNSSPRRCDPNGSPVLQNSFPELWRRPCCFPLLKQEHEYGILQIFTGKIEEKMTIRWGNMERT